MKFHALPTSPHVHRKTEKKKVGKFGLQVQELTKEMAQRFKLGVQRGVIVTDVTENSLAAQQGIEREDVITEVDGKPVTDVKTFRDALNQADPKRGVLLYLDRKGSKTFAVLKAGGGEPRTTARTCGCRLRPARSADETDAAYDRRKTDPMTLGVLDSIGPSWASFFSSLQPRPP